MGKVLIFLMQLVGIMIFGLAAIILVFIISCLAIGMISAVLGIIADAIKNWRNK